MGIFSSSSVERHGKPVALGQCSRPALAQIISVKYQLLGGWLGEHQVPIVYAPVYNIGFLGVSRVWSICFLLHCKPTAESPT